jgi:uncharacterized protein YegP (UPF0339 family)
MMKFLRKIFGEGEQRPARGDTRITYWRTLPDATGIAVWNWHCQDGNNEVVCGSTQGYQSEAACLRGIANAQDAMCTATPVRRDLA